MGDFETCRRHSSILEKKISESTLRWKTFSASQSNYRSMMCFEGKSLPAPVMTLEKRRKMQMYKKQANIVEVRIKSRSREKEFLSKIQGALDEVRDFHFDSSESVSTDTVEDMGHSSHFKIADDSLLPHPSSLESSIDKTKAEPRIPEAKPLKRCLKAKSATDISRVGKLQRTPHEKQEIFEEGVKRGRRRYNSEGKSDSESRSLVQAKPCKSNGSPSRCKKSHSNSNLLTIPFEQYEQKIEELKQHGLSKPRQRYREERARSNALRTPSPQPAYKEVPSQSNRPVSTPPDIAASTQLSNAANPYQSGLKESGSFATVVTHTVSCKALKSLLETLDPSHDQPTHRWLTARMSDQEKNADEDISLEDWFQNAPDSVKQKLASLLPKVSCKDTQETDDRKVVNKSVDVQISPVHTCNLSDDTLRSPSPLPDEDIHSASLSEYIVNPMTEDLPLLVIDKSPNASQKISRSFARTDSSTVLEPSGDSFETVVEFQTCLRKEEPIVPPLLLSPNEPPQSNTLDNSANGMTAAGDRKRSLSMQSYTVEEPSEALINFTFGEKHDKSPEVITDKPNPLAKTPSSSRKHADSQKISRSQTRYNADLDLDASSKKKMEHEKSTNFKSRIPTATSTRALLSRCNLDTPSPVVGQEPEQLESSRHPTMSVKVTPTPSNTPINAARHRHLLKILKRSELNENRSLTPTPPSRVMTPTPPSRPKSEMGTRWSRSRSQPRSRTAKQDSAARNVDGGSELKETAGVSENSSCYASPSQPVIVERRAGRRVRRSASCTIASVKAEKSGHHSNDVESQESPLKDYAGKDDRLVRARKQLALLKAKFSAKVKQLNFENLISEGPMALVNGDTTSFPEDITMEKSQVDMVDSRKFPTATVIRVVSPTTPSNHIETSDDGKENISVRQHSRCPNKSLTDHEEMPISTVYSTSNSSDTVIECSSLGNILSVSHKTNKLSPDKPDEQEVKNPEKRLHSADSQPMISGDKLYALVQGHLCRKLFKCSKVKSIIKTIQDCRNLLPSITSVNNKSALYDVNFQQRLKQQMVAARDDLHEIFFKLPSYQRITLIKQSEMVLARHRLRQTKAKSSKSEGTRTAQNIQRRNNANLSNIMVKPRIHSANTTTAPALRRHILQNGNMKPLAV